MRNDYLRIAGASKWVDGMELLRDFCLTLYEQEITMIVGASILEMNSIAALMAGREHFTSGSISFRGRLVNRSGSMSFWREHVAVLSAQNRLIESVSIVDNFFVCIEERQPFFAQDRKHKRILQELLDIFGLDICLEQPVNALSILQQYQLLLLKCYYHSAEKAVFLDKRKIPLSAEDFLSLYKLIHQLKQRGMTFLVLDYTIGASWEMIDVLVTIKEACTILQADVAFLTEQEKQIFRQEELYAQGDAAPAGQENRPVVLELEAVRTKFLHGADLKLHAGEIAAVYYTDYEAAQNLFKVLNGSESVWAGEVRIGGDASTASNRVQRAREGVICVEEYQADDYLFENLTALENFCLQKGLRFKRLWWSRRYQRYLRKTLNRLAGREIAGFYPRDLEPREVLQVKYQSQILARPAVLVCMDPFSSVDQFLRREVELLLDRLAAGGAAVLLFSRLDRIRKVSRYTQYELKRRGELQLNSR